jgi:hypothetical protein
MQPFNVSAVTTLSMDLGSMYNDVQPNTNVQFDAQVPLYTEWGKKGSKRWGIVGGYAIDFEGTENRLVRVGIEIEHFVENNLSLDLGLHLLDVKQSGKDAYGLNASVRVRWHFIDEDTWSMFIEGGVGLLRTSANVPSDGSEFNFTTQIGSGFSFDAGNNNRWLIGVRWFHISNANTYNNNPSRDSVMLWTGISFPY